MSYKEEETQEEEPLRYWYDELSQYYLENELEEELEIYDSYDVE